MADSVRGGADKAAEGMKEILRAMNDPNSRIDLGPPERTSAGTTEIKIQISQQSNDD